MIMPIGRHVSQLAGYAPALPTPFNSEGGVDAASFERLCALQVGAGATALVVCGTTGEAPTLTPPECRELIQIAVGAARGVPVIAGAGSNATSHAIELTAIAEKAGADAILSVVPYYNKPTQAGLKAHFSAIAQSTDLPIILYDVPSRTVCGLADSTVAELAENPRFIGLKDATGDIARVSRLRALVGHDFRLLSGDDATALAYLVNGGNGCISVTSNVAPAMCREMYLAVRSGNMKRAQRLAGPIAELTAALFLEPNPVPIKFALSLLGLILPAVRLPLVEANSSTQDTLRATIEYLSERDETLAVKRPVAQALRQAIGRLPHNGARYSSVLK
jgi:4-hydroxy-tetrahydrodipicolinate synthase